MGQFRHGVRKEAPVGARGREAVRSAEAARRERRRKVGIRGLKVEPLDHPADAAGGGGADGLGCENATIWGR